MKVLVTGASGMVGAALIEALTAGGHEPGRLLRNRAAAGEPYWNPEEGTIDLGESREFDAVVHLAGDNIAAGRWTPRKKERILNSRVNGTTLLADCLVKHSPKPRVLVSASAIGFYGDRGQEIMHETSLPGSGFLADVCQRWEAATAPAAAAGIRVVNIRLGLVLSPEGGALKKMLFPFKMGLGGIIGSGDQYMSWIGIDDVVGGILHAIATESLHGPVNLVSPKAVTNREFTRTLGKVLHRPTLFPLPGFVARMAFGEMADALLLSGARVAPGKLTESNYPFRHSSLEEALSVLLGKSGSGE